MNIETSRLFITRSALDMAETVRINSPDADNHHFVADEIMARCGFVKDFEGPAPARVKNGTSTDSTIL